MPTLWLSNDDRNKYRRQKYSDDKEKKKKDERNERRRKGYDPEKRRERYLNEKKKGNEQMENNTNQNEETMRTPSKVPSTPTAPTPTAPTPIRSTPRRVLAQMTPQQKSRVLEINSRKKENLARKEAKMNAGLGIMGKLADSMTELTSNLASTTKDQNDLEDDELAMVLAEAEAEAAAEAEAEAEMRESKDGVKNLLTEFDNTDADGRPTSVRFVENDIRFFNGESPPNSVRSPGKGILKNAFDRMIECFSPSSSEEGDDTNYYSPRSEEERSGEDRSGEDVESNKPEESNNFEGYDDELAAAAKIPIDGAKVDDTVFENAPEVHGGTEESKEEIGNEDDSKEDDTGIKLKEPPRRRKKNYFQGRSPRRSLRFQKNKGTDQV